MPAGSPQYGELWSLHDAGDRDVAAIVSDTSHILYTLVSLTGMRMRFPTGREYRWDFVREVSPSQGALCERHGCANAGFLRYSAPVGFGYACPRHIPIGLELTILEGIPNDTHQWRQPPVATPCLSCSNPDPIEDVRPSPLGISEANRFWTCLLCGMNWVDSIASPQLEGFGPDHPGYTAREFLNIIEANIESIRAIRQEPERILLPIPIWTTILSAQRPLESSGARPGSVLFGVPCEPNAHLENITIPLRKILGRPIQRLGGQPNRSTTRTPRSVQEQLQAELSPEEELTPIVPNTLWVQRKVGDIIEVVSCEKIPSKNSTQGTEIMVILRRLYDQHNNPTVPLTRKDFLKLYIPYIEKTEPEIIAPPQISAGEEWESANGDAIYIVSVDARKEVIIGETLGSKKAVRLSFDQFTGGSRQWRKIVRLTAYERMLQEDDI